MRLQIVFKNGKEKLSYYQVEHLSSWEKKEENVYLHLLKNKVTIQWREKFKLEDVISHGFKPRGTWTWTITWITWISGPNNVWEFQ